jgi:hypothetical protein
MPFDLPAGPLIVCVLAGLVLATSVLRRVLAPSARRATAGAPDSRGVHEAG